MFNHKTPRTWFIAGILLSVLAAWSNAQEAPRHPVLMISIDGMHPSYVIEAGKHGLKLPVLSGFLTKGSYAERVINVSPTVTYPNHTTLVTGVAPAEHGIRGNTVFDPFGKEQGAWNWYGAQVKVPTLWQAAKAAGLVTGSAHWPVTVHSKGIDYNVPEFWRNKRELDHYLLEAVSTPPGFLEEAEKITGPYYGDSDLALDDKIAKVTIHMIEKAHPDFLTVHIVSLDHVEHATGPFSKEAVATLEEIDGMVGRIMAAELKAHPNADVAIVSDHGFFPVRHHVNLNSALREAGLLSVSGSPEHLASWKAYAWSAGGSTSIALENPNDHVTEEKAGELLDRLAKDPVNGINRVLRGSEAAANGAMAGTAFVVDWKSGYAQGGRLTGPVVQDLTETTGTHGYLNIHPEINSSFFIQGPGIANGKTLGVIDMRQIAPTLARELKVSLPAAKMQPLPVRN